MKNTGKPQNLPPAPHAGFFIPKIADHDSKQPADRSYVGGIKAMWTTPFLENYFVPAPPLTATTATPEHAGHPVRRRSTTDQARAIRTLENAINHLSYSHLFVNDRAAELAQADTIHLLRWLKRQVFEDCEKITSSTQPIHRWMIGQRLNPSN
jgi:hypothetical protein